MAKHTLNTTDEDFDFVLIGLVCLENQYHVISNVNQALKINLVLSDYLPFNLKGGKLFNFSLYHFLDEAMGIEYSLIPNTSNFDEPDTNQNKTKDLFAEIDVDESVKLIKELPKTDYFILLKGEDLHNYRYKIIDLLKTIPDIIQVQSIEASELASKRNLIF
ncbi:MAG: IPExxxVDY family protein [Bacteroidota bacterium]|nr:IPExxxVDY family protein [Bacteroidota bacterium]